MLCFYLFRNLGPLENGLDSHFAIIRFEYRYALPKCVNVPSIKMNFNEFDCSWRKNDSSVLS